MGAKVPCHFPFWERKYHVIFALGSQSSMETFAQGKVRVFTPKLHTRRNEQNIQTFQWVVLVEPPAKSSVSSHPWRTLIGKSFLYNTNSRNPGYLCPWATPGRKQCVGVKRDLRWKSIRFGILDTLENALCYSLTEDGNSAKWKERWMWNLIVNKQSESGQNVSKSIFLQLGHRFDLLLPVHSCQLGLLVLYATVWCL